jgi:hypothetical protein
MPSRKTSRAKSRSTSKSRKKRSVKALPPTFAAKLGAFLLESVTSKVVFNKKTGFTDKHPQVFGVLPYLHMNITQEQFARKLDQSTQERVNSMVVMCHKQNLESKLSKVGFNCNKQSNAGVKSINKAIIDSINNKWGSRQNGRKHLREVRKAQQWQHSKNIIPASSLKWCQ